MLSFAQTAGAQVYKWVSETGEVQYSQFPPPKGKADEVNVSATPDTTQSQKELDEKLKGFDERREKRLKADEGKKKEEEKQAALKKQCDTMRQNLNTLMNNRRVTHMVNGKPVVMPHEEKEKEIKLLQKNIKEHCSNL